MNALKISLRFGAVRSPSLLSNELRQLSVKSNLANNFQSIAVARNYSQISLQKNTSVIQWNGRNHSLSAVIMRRWMSSQEITKNIKLITEEPRKIEKDEKTLRLKQDFGNKPLVVIFSWLQSKQKHLMKYAQLYIDQGFDVTIIQVSAWQLLWPVKGSQQVAEDVVKFLANNDYYRQIILHGFSVGGYVFGECLVHMNNDRKKYQSTVDRIVAQIWDSAADITEIPVGVPKALFPRNPGLQAPLRNYMIYHMRTFHEAATQHYIRSSQMFHTNFVHAPALFIVSNTDPVGAVPSNRRVADSWIKNGVNVTWKCFENSPHVMHFMKHREEYKQWLFGHLASVNMIKYPDKIRAKL